MNKKPLWFQTDLFGPGTYMKKKTAPAKKPSSNKSAKKPTAKKG